MGPNYLTQQFQEREERAAHILELSRSRSPVSGPMSKQPSDQKQIYEPVREPNA